MSDLRTLTLVAVYSGRLAFDCVPMAGRLSASTWAALAECADSTAKLVCL
jgi:hypothetical protein